MIDVKKDFPILKRKINGKQLIYLDSGATSQKPKQVIDALKFYYENYNANTHRGVHTLSEEATDAFEKVREKVAKFINAERTEEIIFVRNTTEAINGIMRGFAFEHIKKGDTILTTIMEHHSNIVPWQQLAKDKKARLEFIDIANNGILKMSEFDEKIKNAKLLAITHCSNVLGTINPLKEMIKKAHKYAIPVIVDAAQSVPHMKVDVQDLDIDFLAFSGHKMLGPTGAGVLYAKRKYLERMQPFLFGGHMIKEVHKEYASWNELPWKFEAGTSDIADVIGLGAAIDYLEKIGMNRVREHEKELVKYALERLSKVEGIEIYGPTNVNIKGGVISFNIKGIHPHDVSEILDSEGIAVRSGHACAQPLLKRLGVAAVARASFYIYNTKSDIDALIKALEKVKKILKK